MINLTFGRVYRHAAGFTLVELMVTVAVLTIALAIGVPQMRTFVDTQQSRASQEALRSAINLARSEALKRSGRVSLCPINSDGTKTCAGTTDVNSWNNGWLIFVDYPNSSKAFGTYESNSDTLIKAEQRSGGGAITTNISRSSIQFQANGVTNSAGTQFNVGTESVCLSFQGRVLKGACPSNQSRTGT
jgi:type IV fimbrial biogenesis protein FimT